MKKVIFPILAILLFGTVLTSCHRDVIVESTVTRSTEVTVHPDDWVRSGNNYYCRVNWMMLIREVVEQGVVSVYVYEGDRQYPLPHIYPVQVFYDDGTSGFVPENLKYSVEPGSILLEIQDLDNGLVDLNMGNTANMVFRIVATAPQNYIVTD
jgi:hypothetical protein